MELHIQSLESILGTALIFTKTSRGRILGGVQFIEERMGAN
jgi:hypothetical protein